MTYFTYIHRRQSDNAVFYVGMGKERRISNYHAYSHSKEWAEEAQKHGVYHEMLAQWETKQEAWEHEKLIIACFKDMGHPLVNKALGGAGSNGYRFTNTEATKAKVSKAKMGNKIWVGRKHKESTKLLQSAAHKGVKKQPWLCVECGKIAGGHSNIIQHQKSTKCCGKQIL